MKKTFLVSSKTLSDLPLQGDHVSIVACQTPKPDIYAVCVTPQAQVDVLEALDAQASGSPAEIGDAGTVTATSQAPSSKNQVVGRIEVEVPTWCVLGKDVTVWPKQGDIVEIRRTREGLECASLGGKVAPVLEQPVQGPGYVKKPVRDTVKGTTLMEPGHAGGDATWRIDL